MAAGTTGLNQREVEKRTYVIEEDGVKKIVEEEIETIIKNPAGLTGRQAQDVALSDVEHARAIKAWHNPVVSDHQKKRITSLKDKNVFSFIGCFGGKDKAFF